jgi:hypothetical protein
MRSFSICCLASLLLLQESVVVAQNTSIADEVQTFVNDQESNTSMEAIPGSTIQAGVITTITLPNLTNTAAVAASTTTASRGEEQVPSNQTDFGATATVTAPTTVVTPTTVTTPTAPTTSTYASATTTTETVDANGADVYTLSQTVGVYAPAEDTEGTATAATNTSVAAEVDSSAQVSTTTSNVSPENIAFTCPLTCENGGVCTEGRLDETALAFSLGIFEEGPLEFHCACTGDFTGLTCEKPFISCNDGEHACLHGGECLASFLDKNGKEQYYCECRNAFFEGMRYAGEFCETQAVDTCQEGPNPIYCVNGSCKANFEETPTTPCACDSGWEGPRCEYASGAAPNCDLDCNTGACRIGMKQRVEPQSNMFEPSDEEHKYCVCPKGFYGENCEFEGSPCGDKHCFNGGTCLAKEMVDGTVQHFCDCSTAFTDEVAYAGEFCEAESSSFCTRLPDHNGQSFCVNGGSCKGES